MTRLLGRCFSEATPLVFVCGFSERCATWITQMTADYLQLPFPRLSLLPIGFAAVVHGHETVARHYRRALYVIRDGRDAMVLFYFHLSKNVPSGDNPPLTAKQKKFFPGFINKNDIVRNLLLFIKQQMKSFHGSCGLNWGQHVQRYLDQPPPDVPRFLRRGQAGDWKNYFSLEALDVFLHYCRPQLRAAGYDADAVPTNSPQR